MPSTDVIQLILTLKVTTAQDAQVVELKHQTFLIHERHELDRVRSLRAKCKSLNKTTLKHH